MIRGNSGLTRLVHSFSLKLVVLALILLSIPLVLYWQFAKAQERQEALIRSAVIQTNQVIAAMLRPHFARFASAPPSDLHDALAAAAVDGTHIKVLMRLKDSRNFLYVAAVPTVTQVYLEAERRELQRSGLFERLGPSCDRDMSLDLRFTNPAGRQEVLAAMTPAYVGGNCWIVITSENARDFAFNAMGFSFDAQPEVMAAGVVYLVSTVLVLWLFVHMWRNIRRFRSTARHIRLRDRDPASFRKTNTIPELNGVAEDFDALVGALTSSERRIREAAEENSHALKTPLAVIAQSLEPIRRAVPPADDSAARSITLIERSVARLDALVSAQRDLDQAGADLIYPVRGAMDFSAFLREMLEAFQPSLTAQGKHLVSIIQPGVLAQANEDLIEPVVENLLENAASFTPPGQAVEVRLRAEDGFACLRVLDKGPGVALCHLPRIFNRGASFRYAQQPDAADLMSGHQGLGLWIVRRNVESLGGRVAGHNRPRGGFEVAVHLPMGSSSR